MFGIWNSDLSSSSTSNYLTLGLIRFCIIAIYGPMIFTAPYVMLLMMANPLRGQVGGGWALEIETSFLDPVKWHQAVT
jgi:hypothetical protein